MPGYADEDELYRYTGGIFLKAFEEVTRGADDSADAALLMTTETSNAYWQGKVNLPFAMARGTVKVEGNVSKLLSLSPLSKKPVPIYIDMLRSEGREDLIV